MKNALVIGGTSGIGQGIANSLAEAGLNIQVTNREILDTGDMNSVHRFLDTQVDAVDVLILNTGGPPAKDFFTIVEEEWEYYHTQLFLSFVLLLQHLKVNDGAYIFLVSSFNIKEPNPKLILSSAYRVALTSVLKTLSQQLAPRNISCINIAPGPIKTNRLIHLVDDIDEFEEGLPYGRAGTVEEIGDFVASIVEKEIKYLNGVTINFDGGLSNYVL